ncbi:hypothetical protein D3C76_858320 [compost metagenome]
MRGIGFGQDQTRVFPVPSRDQRYGLIIKQVACQPGHQDDSPFAIVFAQECQHVCCLLAAHFQGLVATAPEQIGVLLAQVQGACDQRLFEAAILPMLQ